MKNLIPFFLAAIFLFIGCAEESKNNPKNFKEAADHAKNAIDKLDGKAGEKVKDLLNNKDETLDKAKDFIDKFTEKNGEKADELLTNKEEKLNKAKEILNKLGNKKGGNKENNGIETDLEDLLDLFGKEDGDKAKDWLKDNDGKINQVRDMLDSLADNSGDVKEQLLNKINQFKDDPKTKERLKKLEGTAKDLLKKFDKIVKEGN